MTPPVPPALPIDACVPDVQKALGDGAHVVLVAPPGAGKSTRLPLALLDQSWLEDRKIILVVPRRLAALGAARRMADELGEPVGQRVGHRVRFDTKVSGKTRLEVVTNGVFTRMITNDPELTDVALVMFDEVHERALAADLGLAFVLESHAALRPDLRLMAMSATVDGARFKALFGDHGRCEEITSAGALFPVTTHHEPSPLSAVEGVTQSAIDALKRFDGDGLIFLPGQHEIEAACRALRDGLGIGISVLPLYGAVSRNAQEAALKPDPEGRRKLVVASAIAETSLTIPGVRFVIDSGLARRPTYDPVRGITRLETKAASRASIDQRRGRAGRLAPGDCIRLWRREEEGGRPAQDRPEIVDADVSGLRLDMALWGTLTRDGLPFLDAPPQRAWDEAGHLLKSLGAIDENGAATPLGARMAKRPTHPRLAAMLEQAAPGEGSDAAWAAILAGELSDRGALNGAQRLQSALQDRKTGKRLRTLHSRFLGKAASHPVPDDTVLARHVLRAFPDRLAKREKDDGQRAIYKLAQGMQATLETHDQLANEAFLLVIDLGGGRKTGTVRVPEIRLALPIAEDVVRDERADHIMEEDARSFDAASWVVRVRKEIKLGAITLSSEAQPRQIGLDALPEITAHVRRKGVESLADRDKAKLALVARHQAFHVAHGEPDALLDRLDMWLPTIVEGSSSPPFSLDHLHKALEAALDWDERQAFDKQWPSSIGLKGDERARILYDHPAGPAISVRPQALYGLDSHPTFGVDHQPILIEMLSPAQRPIALTANLSAFWRAGWKDVRKDMRARYPKHNWPQEPWLVPTGKG